MAIHTLENSCITKNEKKLECRNEDLNPSYFDINGIVMTEWVPESQDCKPNLLFGSFDNIARAN